MNNFHRARLWAVGRTLIMFTDNLPISLYIRDDDTMNVNNLFQNWTDKTTQLNFSGVILNRKVRQRGRETREHEKYIRTFLFYIRIFGEMSCCRWFFGVCDGYVIISSQQASKQNSPTVVRCIMITSFSERLIMCDKLDFVDADVSSDCSVQ